MTDRDIEIGRLQASTESLRNQSADQYRRIDVLEVAVGKLEERVVGLSARLDSLGAPKESEVLPGKWDWLADRKTWAVLLAVAGIALGWWNLDDVRSWLGGQP